MRALILLAALLALPAYAQEQITIRKQRNGSMVVTVPASKVKSCEAEGGCRILSVKEMADFIESIKTQICNNNVRGL